MERIKEKRTGPDVRPGAGLGAQLAAALRLSGALLGPHGRMRTCENA